MAIRREECFPEFPGERQPWLLPPPLQCHLDAGFFTACSTVLLNTIVQHPREGCISVADEASHIESQKRRASRALERSAGPIPCTQGRTTQ